MESYTLTINCMEPDQTYWMLNQTLLPPNSTDDNHEDLVFNANSGFGFFIFNGQKLPNALAAYATSLIAFYVGVVYLFSNIFRSAMVPKTAEIFIVDAPYTEETLNVCQAVYIYRFRRDYVQEEYVYFLLIDIFRSPEMIKKLCGSSIKPMAIAEDPNANDKQ